MITRLKKLKTLEIWIALEKLVLTNLFYHFAMMKKTAFVLLAASAVSGEDVGSEKANTFFDHHPTHQELLDVSHEVATNENAAKLAKEQLAAVGLDLKDDEMAELGYDVLERILKEMPPMGFVDTVSQALEQRILGTEEDRRLDDPDMARRAELLAEATSEPKDMAKDNRRRVFGLFGGAVESLGALTAWFFSYM